MVTHGHESGPPTVRFLDPAFHCRLANGRILSPMLPGNPRPEESVRSAIFPVFRQSRSLPRKGAWKGLYAHSGGR